MRPFFFRDGEPVKRENEEHKNGPGVLWLDSASGVVTPTAAAYRNTFGPGVHFTENNEKIAGYVDLHIQTDRIGPGEGENPFAEKNEQQSDIEYASIQKRRYDTSALTRDGIEVVPNISITFKIDADPVTDPNLPGSRFGFDEQAVPVGRARPTDSFEYAKRFTSISGSLEPASRPPCS